MKNSIKSLHEVDPELSVWPNTSFFKMKQKFEDFPPIAPGFCIRKYLAPSFFKNEKRYWVMGANIHHSCGKIPEVVREAASRLSVLKGVFYTIDATPELIIEVGQVSLVIERLTTRRRISLFGFKKPLDLYDIFHLSTKNNTSSPEY